MAVAIEEIKILYRELNQSIKDALDAQEAANKLTSQDYASVLTKLLGMNLEMAVKTVQGQPMLDAQLDTEKSKKDSLDADTSLKGQQELTSKAQATSLAAEDLIKATQSSNDTKVKAAQVSKAGEETSLMTKQIAVEQYTIDNLLPEKLAKAKNENTILVTQNDEYQKLNAATIAAKEEDIQVKMAQEGLLVKQGESLDNALIKDVLKEASGGYAMVYDTLSNPTTPGTWAAFDHITNELLTKAGSSYTVPVQVNTQNTTN